MFQPGDKISRTPPSPVSRLQPNINPGPLSSTHIDSGSSGRSGTDPPVVDPVAIRLFDPPNAGLFVVVLTTRACVVLNRAVICFLSVDIKRWLILVKILNSNCKNRPVFGNISRISRISYLVLVALPTLDIDVTKDQLTVHH